MKPQVFDCREKLHDYLNQPCLVEHYFTITRTFDVDSFLASFNRPKKSRKTSKQSFKIANLKVYDMKWVQPTLLAERPLLADVVLTERLYEELAKEFRFQRTEYYRGGVDKFREKLLPFKTKLLRFAEYMRE